MTDVSYAVLLHGEHVGTIQRRDADTTFSVFAFDRDYWNRPDRHALGAWFENHPRKRPHNNLLPAWFSNLLREGRLREIIAHEQGVSTHKEMDLLERIGGDLPGAVEVRRDTACDVDDTLDRFSETWADGAVEHTPERVLEWIDTHLAGTRQQLLGH